MKDVYVVQRYADNALVCIFESYQEVIDFIDSQGLDCIEWVKEISKVYGVDKGTEIKFGVTNNIILWSFMYKINEKYNTEQIPGDQFHDDHGIL